MDRHRVVKLQSYAKVNLTLDVRERLPNGYHLLQAVFQQISLSDEITVQLTDSEGISLQCSRRDVPADSTNLAWIAAERFFSHLGEAPHVHIALRKLIPVQAGLGGGSGNAAAVLRALNTIFGSPLTLAQLHRLAASIGADVPFFLYGGTALVEGIGDVVKPLPAPVSYPMVVAYPSVGISTAWAYEQIDRQREVDGTRLPPAYTPRMVNSLQEGRLWIPLLHNDFEAVVLPAVHEVQEVKRLMLSSEALGVLLCGSGSAVFGVFEDDASAHRAMLGFREQGIQAWKVEFCSH